MASFIFSIAEKVLEQLSTPIVKELSLAWGVNDDLFKLKNTVSDVRCVLLDAQEKQLSSHQLRNWLEKLEDALYRAEDVFEEFEIIALRKKASSQSILGMVFHKASLPKNIIEIAHKVKKVREEFDEIAADTNRTGFGLIERLDDRVVVPRKETQSFVRDEDVMGRKDERKAVISFLLETSDNESVSVLPIVGLGGMGKTTLAQLVYNDETVVNQFDLRIWVCISEEFEVGEVIKKILKSANVPDCDSLPLDPLRRCLQEKLNGKKYLLILDDVWNENRVKWEELKSFLLGGKTGSKIIVTTRNKPVASIMDTRERSIELQGLPHEECMSIFLKWAFKSSDEANKYPHLNKIAGEIVKKCKGVPLAVRTLGSLLYTKTEERQWINVRDNDIWKMEQHEEDIMPALKLSYYHLPTYLRRCFVFCSIFPKDSEIRCGQLIRYWQANGMLKSFGNHQEMEDVGMKYIKQLLSRGFFQEFEDEMELIDSTFKMHDLVHDLALLVSQHDCISFYSQDFSDCSPNRKVRHISFPRNYFSTKEIPNWLLEQKENVRTIAFPDGVGDSKISFIKTFISKFKSLHMLDLHSSSFEVLPSSIGGLKHLKCLDLSYNDELKSLPDSICELVGLEVLLLESCVNIKELPAGFGKLIQLRELKITTKGSCLPELQCLTSLQILSITDCPNLKFVMRDDSLECLSALRSFEIVRCRSLVALPLRGLRHLTQLETLDISVCDNLNLMMDYSLDNSKATSSEINQGGFPNLHKLVLWNLPKLEIFFPCFLHGANNLKQIYFVSCKNLTKFMPEGIVECLKSLQTLIIDSCPKLVSLPEEMLCLTTLEEVKIVDCPELIRRSQREIGWDWNKISLEYDVYLGRRRKI